MRAPQPEQLPHSTSRAQSEKASRIPAWLNPSRVAAQLKGPAPDQNAATALFNRAEKQFAAAAKSKGESRYEAFAEAAKIYETSAERGKGFAVEEDALMMAAEAHFFADDYPKATEAYGKLVKFYPNTQYMDRVDQRRFSIAQYWLQNRTPGAKNLVPNLTDDRRPAMDTFGNALKLFDRIRFDDPTGRLSDDATMAAAVANFQRGKFVAADELLTDIRENFPSSEHQYQAHLLGLKCKLMSYEGPDYDGGALDDAEDIIRQLVTQFPQDAREHHDLLADAHKDIRLRKAHREYALAQYYDRRKEYRAARMHYDNVRQQYGDTNLAVEAESRLAQLDGRPDVPKQSLEWLSGMFPEENTRQLPLIPTNPTGGSKR
jgi:outer membrane protein assembly factor BamD (BamD/ComL family)